MGKFKIPRLPATTQRNIRFPNYLIEDIEELIKGENSTFSAFVVEACRNAVEELREEQYAKKYRKTKS